MAKASKKWTKKDYTEQAQEFVACYGKNYCWDEVVDAYCHVWDGPLPFDPERLLNEIMKVMKVTESS